MPKFWKRKGKAVKKWRSRAWSIDPSKTNLIIIKAEKNIEGIDTADSNLNFNMNFSRLLENYPQYFDAIEDME